MNTKLDYNRKYFSAWCKKLKNFQYFLKNEMGIAATGFPLPTEGHFSAVFYLKTCLFFQFSQVVLVHHCTPITCPPCARKSSHSTGRVCNCTKIWSSCNVPSRLYRVSPLFKKKKNTIQDHTISFRWLLVLFIGIGWDVKTT